MAEAILANKSLRKPPSGTAFYVVDVTCSNCWHVARVGYAGWTALVCFRCGYQMDRTRYRCTNKAGARARHEGRAMGEVTHDDMKNHWLLCAEVIAAAERLVDDARVNGTVDWAVRPEKVALAKAVGALQADRRRMGGE